MNERNKLKKTLYAKKERDLDSISQIVQEQVELKEEKWE